MKEKLVEKYFHPKLHISIIICLILICILFYYNIILAVLGLIFLIAAMVFDSRIGKQQKKDFNNIIENLTDTMDATVKKNIVTNPLPICIIDRKGNLNWYNRKFSELFNEEELIYKNIHNLLPLFKADEVIRKTLEETPVQMTISDRVYKIISTDSTPDDDDNMLVLYFIDITAFENLKKINKDDKSCAVHIFIDNFEEIMMRAAEDKRADIQAQIEKEVRQFAQKNTAPLIKYDDDKYYLVLDNKHLGNVIENKFSILDEVRKIETNVDLPVSLSIGVGAAGKTYLQNHEYAQAAIELALGRGGDQAVVKKINKVDYYGGRLQAVEKRNKGKSRIMSHALQRLMEQSSGVLIMGHKNADMDAFGAAVGIHSLAKKCGVTSAIVMDFVGESLSGLYEYVKSTDKFSIISSERALSIADKEMLLVVVDTHSPYYVECPELIKKIEKTVVIDHHRKMENSIENPQLAYMESYASSTCELVTEILQYAGKDVIGKTEADALLAGITLDTKHFSTQSGVRTFEAASYLRRLGADTAKISGFFKVEPNLFRIKAKAIVDSELIKTESGIIAISKCDYTDENIGLITAQTADEMLEIRGVRGAAVMGINRKSEVIISARSTGDLNVQIIMEKMGGGGHLNTAGAQVKMSLEEAEAMLRKIISEELN